MLDAFIIDKLKREKRREKRKEIQIPIYIEEPPREDYSNSNKKDKEKDSDPEKKYYERIDIETE
jgi:hypothetical protein